MTDPEFDRLLESEIAWATEQRVRLGTDGENDFHMRVRIILEDDEIVETPFVWHDDREKLLICKALHVASTVLKPQAVIVTSDSRCLDTQKFSQYFGIYEPTLENINEWGELHGTILKKYGNTMANLPKELWADTLMSAIRGPKVDRALLSSYRIEKGAFVFEPVDKVSGRGMDGLIQKWW